MGSTRLLSINGYDIFVHVGDWGQGVCFHPDTADFSDPAFIDALKQAADAYPYIYALGYLWYTLDFEEPHFSTVTEGIQRGILPADSLEELATRIEDAKAKTKKKAKNGTGYVYVLSSDSGLYKIGKTRDYKNRIRTFGVKLPFMVAYELVTKSDNYHALEQQLHQRFDHLRVDGEWFALTPDDLTAIKADFPEVR